MTYCLGIKTTRRAGDGLRLPVQRRLRPGQHLPEDAHVRGPGERVFVLLPAGASPARSRSSPCCDREFDEGRGLATAETFYDAARAVGEQVRRVAEPRPQRPWSRTTTSSTSTSSSAGQIRGQPHELYLIYPQGNPLCATDDSPFLQIGECKYGRPILDRGVRYDRTTLEDAARYAMISIDSTMRSNVTVGPPIDLLVYNADEFRVTRYRRFAAKDPDLLAIHAQWEQALRKAVQEIPEIDFDPPTDEG